MGGKRGCLEDEGPSDCDRGDGGEWPCCGCGGEAEWPPSIPSRKAGFGTPLLPCRSRSDDGCTASFSSPGVEVLGLDEESEVGVRGRRKGDRPSDMPSRLLQESEGRRSRFMAAVTMG